MPDTKVRPGEQSFDSRSDELNPANQDQWKPEGWDEPFRESARPWKPEGWDEPFDESARPSNKPVENAEANATPSAGNTLSSMSPSEGAMSAAAGASAIPNIATNLSPAKTGWNKAIFRGITRKRASLIGGGIGLTGGLFTIYFAGASLYLVHLKEYMTGATNSINSTISEQLGRRRTNSMVRILKSGSQKIQTDAFISKARAEGIDVVVTRGKVDALRFNGETLDLAKRSERQIVRDLKNLNKNGTSELTAKLSSVSDEFSSRASGVVARRSIYQKYLGIVGLYEWIGARIETRAGPDSTERPKAAFSDALINADETDQIQFRQLGVEDAARQVGIDPSTLPEGTDVADIGQEATEQAEEFKASKLEPAGGAEALRTEEEAEFKNATSDVIDEAANALESVRVGAEGADEAVTTVAPKLGSNVGKKVLQVVGGIDILSAPRNVCRLSGTLEFVASLRNTLMMIELAKFGVRWMTIADHQKAGLAQSTSINLMSIYLAGAAGSSGVQSIVNGSPVSTLGLDRYGTGSLQTGSLATVSAFLRSLPGMSPENCKTINQPLVVAGGVLAGGVLAVASGGSSAALSFSQTIGLTLATEIAYGIAIPIMIGSMTSSLINGYESDPGTMAASATQAFITMSTSAQGVLPTSNGAFVGLAEETKSINQVRLAKASFTDRIFNYQNSSSLVARASLVMPQSLTGVGELSQNVISQVSNLNPLTSLIGLTQSKKAYANSTCPDVNAQSMDVACDGFGNPILASVVILEDHEAAREVLRTNNQIDGAGQPINEFAAFVEECFSGRPGLLQPVEVKTDGSTGSANTACVPWQDHPVYGGVFAGTTVLEEIEEGQPARVPTKRELYAYWYGSIVDEENLSAEINGTGAGQSNSTATSGLAGLTGPVIPCEGQPRAAVLRNNGVQGVDWSGITPSGTLDTGSAQTSINVYVREACAGQSPIRTLVLGTSVHGQENTGQLVAHELLFNEQLPPDVRVVAIPEINKWGIDNNARRNQNSVDLNRNFDYRWEDVRCDGVNERFGDSCKGAGPASEPETKAVQGFLTGLGETSLVISYHSNLDWVAPSGPYASKSLLLARRYRELSGLNRLVGNNNGYGFFEAWYSKETGTPALLVELSSEKGSDYAKRHADTVVRLFEEGLVR